MRLALGVLAIALCGWGGLLLLHRYELRRWQRSLRAFRLYLPHDLSVDVAAQWLSTLAAATHPPRGSLFPVAPLVLEVQASAAGIGHYLFVDPSLQGKLLASVQATLPGARLEPITDDALPPRPLTTAREYTLTSRVRPLALERAETVSSGLLAALQPLYGQERVVLQLLLTSAGTPGVVPTPRRREQPVLPWWLEASAPADADALRAQRAKQREPLFAATFRLGAAAATLERARRLLSRPGSLLYGLNAPGVRLVRRLLPGRLVAARLARHRYPLFSWPLLLNVRETAGLAGLPFGVHLPGLSVARARQLPPAPTVPTGGSVVGVSNYPGLERRVLALRSGDRLRHVHLIGPTGTGKSTLLAQMVLQDIARGRGVVVVDPKGDLVNDIAARIPLERSDQVILLDPSEVKHHIIGFNPLRAMPADSATRELVADHVLNIFHSIYKEFWGPRTDEILRATLFSLTHLPAPDGNAFTLIEVPEVLTNPGLRRYISGHPALPSYLRAFWQWFDGTLSEGDRAQAIGPVLNKLRAFSMRSNIRLMLGQSRGITINHRFANGGILLISLAKGKIGAEAASLLGSLFVSTLWQATQARVTLPAAQRTPVFAYLDEFQDVVRLGAEENLAEMLAQARGLGLSLTLAHQYLSQLPRTVREATLGTVRSHIAFQLEWDDARALEARFAPLTRSDLAGLAVYEFALKPCVDGETLGPATGVTLPLEAPTHDVVAIARASRERFGMPRAQIEAGLAARRGGDQTRPAGRFGREATGGRP